MRDVDARMIEGVYARMRKAGLSGTTARQIHVLLKNVFKKAVDYDLVARNPCDLVDAPRRCQPDRRALRESEGVERAALAEKEARQAEWVAAFGRSAIRGVSTLSCHQAVLLALATGMRRGATWTCWGARCGCASRSRQKVRSRSRRRGRACARWRPTARRRRRWPRGRRCRLWSLPRSGQGRAETPVCCSDVGGFLGGSNLQRWWRRWRAAHGFEGLRFHELRHTQATLLLARGIDVKTVQHRMGHANAAITLNWYAHAVPENDVKAANELAAALATGGSEKPNVIRMRTA